MKKTFGIIFLLVLIMLMLFSPKQLVFGQNSCSGTCSCPLQSVGDINCDSKIDMTDFEILRKGYYAMLFGTPTPTPTCTPRPACLDNTGDAGPCVIPSPVGGWCPKPTPSPTPIIPDKIQGLKVTRTANSLTISWDPYPHATGYIVYRNRQIPTETVSHVYMVATVTQPYYTDVVSQIPDLFTDDSINYLYSIRAVIGPTEVAYSNIVGEYDYDVSKNKYLFISFPYTTLPFSNVGGFVEVLKSQGITSATINKWNPDTQTFRTTVWNGPAAGITGDNFTIAPLDTVVLQTYTRASDQTGSIVFSGVMPEGRLTFQLKQGLNMIPIMPWSSYAQASELGNALLPQAIKVYNTKDTISPTLPFIEYKLGAWTGNDFSLYKGWGYFVEVNGDATLTQ